MHAFLELAAKIMKTLQLHHRKDQNDHPMLLRKAGVRGAATLRLRRITPALRALTTGQAKEEPMEGQEQEPETPWYLRSEESSTLTKPVFQAEKPVIPANAPTLLEPLVESLISLGLAEFKVFDIRDRDDIPMSSLADFCIVCEGKSEKHIQNATQEVITLIKHRFGVVPEVEGLVKPNTSMKMKKRLKMKKPVNDFGVGINSWIMLDTQTGVFLNLLTPERREMLNLEYLWCPVEEKDQYRRRRDVAPQHDDSIFAGIFRRSYSTGVMDLEKRALQSFQLDDLQTFQSLLPQIKGDPQVSLTVLSHIVQALRESDIDQTFALSPDGNKYYTYFNESFPLTPTLEHWHQRFQLIEILHNLFPQHFMAEMLSQHLLLQITSGLEIQEAQLVAFVRVLHRSISLNPPQEVMDVQKVTYISNQKANELARVLRAYTSVNRANLPDELVLDILKLYTQQHQYGKSDEVIPLSPVFGVILETFAKRSSPEIVEFVLVSFLKANDTESFWKYWTELYEYQYQEDQVILEQRHWDVLTGVLADNYHERLCEQFLNYEFRKFVDNGFTMTPQMKQNVQSLLKKYDSTGELYPGL